MLSGATLSGAIPLVPSTPSPITLSIASSLCEGLPNAPAGLNPTSITFQPVEASCGLLVGAAGQTWLQWFGTFSLPSYVALNAVSGSIFSSTWTLTSGTFVVTIQLALDPTQSSYNDVYSACLDGFNTKLHMLGTLTYSEV